MTLVIPFTCVIFSDGRRGKGPVAQYWHKCVVSTTWKVESNPQVKNACQIHQSWERGLRPQHTHSPDNCWSWTECKSRDAFVDIHLLHRLCLAPLLHFAIPKFFIFPYTRIHRMLRLSQYPLSILIFFIYPRHLLIKFLPLKLSTQRCATDIKITGTKI